MRKWLAVAGGRVPSTSDRMLGVTCLVCLEPEATFGSGNHPKHFETKAWFVHVCPNILHCYIAGFFFLGFLGISLLEKDSISLRAWRIGSLLWVPFTKSMAVECQVLRQVRIYGAFLSHGLLRHMIQN